VTRHPPGGRQSGPRHRDRLTVDIATDAQSLPRADRIEWGQVLPRAAELVESYTTGVKLRQLFYRLVSAQLIPNRQAAYKRLSELSAVEAARWPVPGPDRPRPVHPTKPGTCPSGSQPIPPTPLPPPPPLPLPKGPPRWISRFLGALPVES
jgi:hypothetical protein